MKKILLFLITLSILFSSDSSAHPSHGRKINVYVTMPPLNEIAKAVGGDFVTVKTLLPRGMDPHIYEPLPHQMEEIEKCDLYIKMGTAIELEDNWLPVFKERNPLLEIANAGLDVETIAAPTKICPVHGHHHHHDHGHGEGRPDPHIWLSPKNAITITKNIRDALVAANPFNGGIYKLNAHGYIKKLENLEQTAAIRLAPYKDKNFLVQHDAWGYLANDYGLNQVVIEFHNKIPSIKDLSGVIRLAKEKDINTVFTSPYHSKRAAEMIAAEIKGKLVEIDELPEHYIANMIETINHLRDSFNE